MEERHRGPEGPEVGHTGADPATLPGLRPNVVVMDVRLPDGEGISACREIRRQSPETRVVMLTSFKEEEAVVGSVRAGASAYVLKETDPEQVISAVQRAAHGESLLDPAVTTSVLSWIREAPDAAPADPLDVLSPHEREIVFLAAEGLTNQRIAERMVLSVFTVKSYVSEVLHKLGLSRRSEIAAFAGRLRAPQTQPVRIGS